MAIIHLVFSKATKGLSEDQMEAAVAALKGLDSLDCVEYLHIGRATGHHVYTHALYARFGSRESLDQYFSHPRHVAIAQEHAPATADDFVAVD
ncbi:hypothetical protein SUGI_0303470 [Cryptomeria japonica]|nr:hypothetical protein SUGI_0303470 [Cryptomeria japonica]